MNLLRALEFGDYRIAEFWGPRRGRGLTAHLGTAIGIQGNFSIRVARLGIFLMRIYLQSQ